MNRIAIPLGDAITTSGVRCKRCWGVPSVGRTLLRVRICASRKRRRWVIDENDYQATIEGPWLCVDHEIVARSCTFGGVRSSEPRTMARVDELSIERSAALLEKETLSRTS